MPPMLRRYRRWRRRNPENALPVEIGVAMVVSTLLLVAISSAIHSQDMQSADPYKVDAHVINRPQPKR